MQFSSQSVSWLPIIRYLVSFPCIYWRSLVLLYTQAHNTHQAFLHNAKYFFKCLCYNSGTRLPGVAESSVSVTKWLTVTWHSPRLLINVSERKHTDHIHVIKHATLHKVTHTHFYQALNVNSATIQCEQQCKPKLSATKIWGNSFKWNFSDKSSCLSVHIMDTVRTQLYAILPSAYC